MATKIKPTNHDSWLVHFHVGVRGKPLTVYLMDDGTYELWFGDAKHIGITKAQAGDMLGHILLSSTRIRL